MVVFVSTHIGVIVVSEISLYKGTEVVFVSNNVDNFVVVSVFLFVLKVIFVGNVVLLVGVEVREGIGVINDFVLSVWIVDIVLGTVLIEDFVVVSSSSIKAGGGCVVGMLTLQLKKAKIYNTLIY